MGNRAVITNKNKEMGIYLHWYGGPESVVNFLKYAEIYDVRSLEADETYGFARLTQIIGNYIGDVISVGIGRYETLDTNNYDNGVYIVDGNWKIAGREFGGDNEEPELYPSLVDPNFIYEIDKAMGRNSLGFKSVEEVEEYLDYYERTVKKRVGNKRHGYATVSVRTPKEWRQLDAPLF